MRGDAWREAVDAGRDVHPNRCPKCGDAEYGALKNGACSACLAKTVRAVFVGPRPEPGTHPRAYIPSWASEMRILHALKMRVIREQDTGLTAIAGDAGLGYGNAARIVRGLTARGLIIVERVGMRHVLHPGEVT